MRPDTEFTRSSAGLREALFDQIEKLRSGKGSVAEARAMAALAGAIVATVGMDIAVAKLWKDYPADMKLDVPAPLKLVVAK